MTEPSVSADSDDVDRRARDFVKVAVLAGVVVVLVYLLAVQTSWGQTWDDSAVIERVKAGKKQIGRAKEVLETIRLPLLIAALALVVIIGVWRKKLRAGIAAAKAEVLEEPFSHRHASSQPFRCQVTQWLFALFPYTINVFLYKII